MEAETQVVGKGASYATYPGGHNPASWCSEISGILDYSSLPFDSSKVTTSFVKKLHLSPRQCRLIIQKSSTFSRFLSL